VESSAGQRRAVGVAKRARKRGEFDGRQRLRKQISLDEVAPGLFEAAQLRLALDAFAMTSTPRMRAIDTIEATSPRSVLLRSRSPMNERSTFGTSNRKRRR